MKNPKKNRIIEVLFHSNQFESSRITTPPPQPIYYKFDEIIESNRPENMRSLTDDIIDKVNSERDVCLIFYGSKRTGKRKLRNLILTLIFDYYDKYV